MPVSKPLIVVETSEVRPGKVGDLLAAMSDLARFVRAREPRLIAYQAYLDEDGRSMTLVEIHPDSTSAEFHLEVIGGASPGLARLMTLTALDVYGEPSSELLAQLQARVETLGADVGDLRVHSPEAGFERLPTGSLLRTSASQRHSMSSLVAV